jgi:GAF domain-containing protein
MAHASELMPYHFNPSENMSDEEKEATYIRVIQELQALLLGETDVILKMCSINCLLKSNLKHYYWVGFYCVNNGRLTVGPYQGTLGCLHIDFKKGVCGAVAASKKTKIVQQVHALSQGDEHIACDPNSQSEIVVPVLNKDKKLIAVFDVDSSLPNSFDEIDQNYLEEIMSLFFEKSELTQSQLQI